MGSGTSKNFTNSSSSSSTMPRRSRSVRSKAAAARVFNNSCFGLPSTLPDDDNQDEEENESTNGDVDADEVKRKEVNLETETQRRRCTKFRLPWHSKVPQLTPIVEHKGEDQEYTSQMETGAGSSSSTTTAAIGRSPNPSGRPRSRFGFIPDRIGFRLSRTVSLGSSRAHSLFSDVLSISNSDRGNGVILDLDSSADDVNEAQDQISMGTNFSRDTIRNNTIAESDISHAEAENAELRRTNRRLGLQEPLEGSVRFSRTLSVGRLRDRVLRRTSSSTGIFGSSLLDDRFVGHMGQANERRVLGSRRRVPSSYDRSFEVWPDVYGYHPNRIASSAENNYEHEFETPPLRETNNHDLMEHRSAFLERRRRIRSQVRALQRLGSRFENLSGHDRSCILSGQHRTGRCTCRAGNRSANPTDEAGTRASISRIVMLAEALFEVLDEIHQQSVVLSSRPSFSSIGSFPAPKEVVECMPVKVYTKPQEHQNEEVAQCYICLVEYEDGDLMRILPCNHEFHQTCIDKWLKEIHRVCPLCRGDVCRADTSGSEKIN